MIAADWEVFVASLDVVDLICEMPGGRRDRAMRIVHAARKREINHPLDADDWAQALVEAAEWNQRYSAWKRQQRFESRQRHECAIASKAARAAQPRGHAA